MLSLNFSQINVRYTFRLDIKAHGGYLCEQNGQRFSIDTNGEVSQNLEKEIQQLEKPFNTLGAERPLRHFGFEFSVSILPSSSLSLCK